MHVSISCSLWNSIANRKCVRAKKKNESEKRDEKKTNEEEKFKKFHLSFGAFEKLQSQGDDNRLMLSFCATETTERRVFFSVLLPLLLLLCFTRCCFAVCARQSMSYVAHTFAYTHTFTAGSRQHLSVSVSDWSRCQCTCERKTKRPTDWQYNEARKHMIQGSRDVMRYKFHCEVILAFGRDVKDLEISVVTYRTLCTEKCIWKKKSKCKIVTNTLQLGLAVHFIVFSSLELESILEFIFCFRH